MRPIFLTTRRPWFDRLRDIAAAIAIGVLFGWMAAQGF